ncbi:MAG TPA: flavodoxin family protein [Sedimentisphaerales bacterium]|nr:flavodoxin family protein [Sedimentisphaerales bacterium]
MGNTIVGIVGSYRKGRVIDSAVTEILKGAESSGAKTVKIYLTEKQIEFCNNCRSCMQEPGDKRGDCVYDDDMEEILQQIDEADGYVLGSPVNLGTMTAIMKRFMERLAVYAYWPWGKIAPKFRNNKLNKKAVIVTSFTPPAWIGRLILPGTPKALKYMAKVLGAKVVKILYFGMVGERPEAGLDEKSLRRAFKTGVELARQLAQ